jgi:uncharacterized membrane protein
MVSYVYHTLFNKATPLYFINNKNMDEVHIHLLITHLPIFASILGGFVLVYGIITNSDSTKMAAYYVLLLSSIGAAIAYSTGEGAEEAVENLQGVSKNMIHQHEEFALFALIGLLALGAATMVALYFTSIRSPLANPLSIIVLLLVLISFGLVARTGYLGGQIRHTEIGTLQPTQDNIHPQSD